MRDQLVPNPTQIYPGTNTCQFITIHETANEDVGANAAAHADLQSNGNTREASWHIQVDDTEAVRSYPDTAQCWHAGNRLANEISIAVEICVNADGDYESAFARAAAVASALRAKHKLGRDAVVQHSVWSGKNCPSRMRAEGRWEEFVALTDPAEDQETDLVLDPDPISPVATPPAGGPEMPGMVSPFQGRLTQNHGDAGGYPGHKGMDIAPPRPGQTGLPVFAAFDGVIVKLHYSAEPGSRGSTWAPGRTGNGLLIRNPDGEGNGYNHVYPLTKLDVGDRVVAGQLLGYNDKSGNQTAPHLHFELWSDWRNPNSDYDPQLAFRKFGIKPGSAPTIQVVPVVAKPKPKPKPPAGKPGSDAAAHRKYGVGEVEAIQKALNRAGYDAGPEDDDYGNRTEDAVADYQREQQFPRGKDKLVADGDWGPGTQAHYEWTRRLQNSLNQWKSVSPKLRLDGDLRSATTRAVGQIQKANIEGAYRRAGGTRVDSQPGPVTCRMLGIPNHP